MTAFARSDQSVLGRWWWTVDRLILAAVAALIGVGIVLIQAATPAVAVKHGLGNFYFVERHLIILVPSIAIMIGASLLPSRRLRWTAVALMAAFLPMLALTPFFGVEIKGAVRWIQLGFFSLQPSEFIKPPFAILSAWLFSRHCEKRGFPALWANVALYMAVMACLLSQPDIGMTFLVSMMWFGQFFLAGMPLVMVVVFLAVGAAGLLAAYYIFPHFAARMDGFIGRGGDTYQADKAMEAFTNGGLLGAGPGEGTVKMSIPDAHADFVFAVAGEEMGLVGCLLIVGLFLFIVLRGLWRAHQENNLFILLATSGLLIEFGLQAAINLASTLRMIPPKGMTLPFISYGGSSLLSLSLGMGLLLALTRKRYGASDY